MEEADRPIEHHVVGKQMSDPLIEIDPVLAHNVIVERYALPWIHISSPNCFQQGPIYVLLLFSAK